MMSNTTIAAEITHQMAVVLRASPNIGRRNNAFRGQWIEELTQPVATLCAAIDRGNW